MSKNDAIREINKVLGELHESTGFGYETPSEHEADSTLAKIADILIDYGYRL